MGMFFFFRETTDVHIQFTLFVRSGISQFSTKSSKMFSLCLDEKNWHERKFMVENINFEVKALQMLVIFNYFKISSYIKFKRNIISTLSILYGNLFFCKKHFAIRMFSNIMDWFFDMIKLFPSTCYLIRCITSSQ